MDVLLCPCVFFLPFSSIPLYLFVLLVASCILSHFYVYASVLKKILLQCNPVLLYSEENGPDLLTCKLLYFDF